MCGENGSGPYADRVLDGSSPRVRGKLCVNGRRSNGPGLIPACAGKTSFTLRLLPRSGAHPRVCGENSRRILRTARAPGSSPRVRGKPASQVHTRAQNGLIPACAGKTGRSGSTLRSQAAHPRVCGENGRLAARIASRSGSSPRVRGKQLVYVLNALCKGLIPACAGKTAFLGLSRRHAAAHPRVCGENNV